MSTTIPFEGIVYARVSDPKQKKDGHGLESQDHRCRQHLSAQGIPIIATFSDDITGGGDFMKRPGMTELLAFIDSNKHRRFVVAFDDLKRFARDTKFHLALREELKARKVAVTCPNFKFEDSPEGEFIETVFAAHGQLERKQHGRQVTQKMIARLEKGYWPFNAPVGYRHEKTKAHGKLLMRDEPLASVVQEALEGYAEGRFQLQAEVGRFLESHPEFPRDSYGKVRSQQIKNILTYPVYAGFVESEYWGVARRMGMHEPIISAAIFSKVQDRLNKPTRAPARKNFNEDFPLRGAVFCGECDYPLTGGWSKGRNAHYPYYQCQRRGCSRYGKSIKRDVLEGEFGELLQSIKPTEGVFRLARKVFEDLWSHRLATQEERLAALKTEAAKLDTQIEKLLDRIVDAGSPTVIHALEKRISDAEIKKRDLEEKIAAGGAPVRSFEESYRTALSFLENPHKLWVSEKLEDKRAAIKLPFADKLRYDRNQGYRTANLALPFKALGEICAMKSKMVGDTGIEPVTPRV